MTILTNYGIMFHSAEEADSEIQTQGLDTQKCLALQKELLSSSPLHSPLLTKDNNSIYDTSSSPPELNNDDQVLVEAKSHNRKIICDEDSENKLVDSLTDTDVKNYNRKRNIIENLSTHVKKLDSLDTLKSPINVDDFTQKSSMSLTQENLSTAFARLISESPLNNLQFISFPDDNSRNQPIEDSIISFHNELEQKTVPAPPILKKFDTCSSGVSLDQEISKTGDKYYKAPEKPQIISRTETCHEDFHRYEPQTPALHVNPFKTKGSVMQEKELFAATQPSSINQRFASPTSSRPSPDTYDDFSSSAKRLKLTVSPLAGYLNESKQLKPSKILLVNPISEDLHPSLTRLSIVQSIDSNPKIKSSSGYKPRPLTSMKEGLRRNRRKWRLSFSDDSDSIPETFPGRQTRLQKELGALEILDPNSENSHLPDNLNLSGPLIIDTNNIKDNQTIHEERNQPDREHDFHDKKVVEKVNPHQDDMIYEISQCNPAISVVRASVNNEEECSTLDNLEQNIENQDRTLLLCSNEHSENHLPIMKKEPHKSTLSRGNISQASTPKKDLPNTLSRVFAKNSNSPCEYSETVPETSPATHRLQPMNEVATISFEETGNFVVDDMPGLTPDVEYENTLGIISSPSPQKPQNSQKIQNFPQQLLSCNRNSSISKRSRISEPVIRPETSYHKFSSQELLNLSSKGKTDMNSEIAPIVFAAHSNSISYEIIGIKPKINEIYSSTLGNPFINENECVNDKRRCPVNSTTINDEIDLEKSRKKLNCTKKTSNQVKNTTISDLSTRRSTCDSGKRLFEAFSKDSCVLNKEKTSMYPSFGKKSYVTPEGNSNLSGRQTLFSKPKSQIFKEPIDVNSNKRISKRKSVKSTSAAIAPSTRSSKRQSLAQAVKDSSEDPLTAHDPQFRSFSHCSGLFDNMAFAVSFVKNDKERKIVTQMISENGGAILEHGFDPLFEPFPPANPAKFDTGRLSLSKLGKLLSFVCVIADEHSRKAKYVQALALGLPCVSGRWIQSCVNKNKVLDWSPFLLCAGQSSVLGNACRSRILQPYSAIGAEFSDIFSRRKKFFEGKSVLIVTGKGKNQQKRETFNFIIRALGPARMGHVVDIIQTKKVLSEGQMQGHEWDLVHVHDIDKNFNPDFLNACKKRKLGDNGLFPPQKRFRIITDEILIQSLIFGELLEE